MSENPQLSKEEETMQRLLGTLPKFQVNVERTVELNSYARVFVTAGCEVEAKKRALEIIDQDEPIDDTKQPVDWTDNSNGNITPPSITDIESIAADDYRACRSEKDYKEPPDPIGV